MKRISASALLFSVAVVMCGCRTVPQPQSTQTAGSYHTSANDDGYNRTYQTEVHHRHHHGRREQAGNDNWSSYDRADTTDEPAGSRGTGAYLPRQNESRSDNGGAAPRSNRHGNSRSVTAAPGQFDFYLLNLSWSPEFCHGHPGAAECTQGRAFSLHGLWPQNHDGTYPEECSEAAGPASPSQYADIYPDPSLLQHEWQMHGTCSGLAPDGFLALARRAEQSIHIPEELSTLTQQATTTPEQITRLLTQSNPGIPASSVAISCGNNYLTAVEVCLDKNLKPGSCSGLKNCGANQIRIAAPQGGQPR